MPTAIMAEIVINENLTLQTVLHHNVNILPTGTPMMKPEMSAATKIPEPVIETQLKVNTAASGVGFTTTGGTRCTMLLTPATGILGAVIALGAGFISARE